MSTKEELENRLKKVEQEIYESISEHMRRNILPLLEEKKIVEIRLKGGHYDNSKQFE